MDGRLVDNSDNCAFEGEKKDLYGMEYSPCSDHAGVADGLSGRTDEQAFRSLKTCMVLS